jgi:branched-chain amino acid transport system substrate-binding protein
MPTSTHRRTAALPALAAGLALALGLASCGKDDAGGGTTLKVGVILPMTGPQATYGEESWNGIQLAKADLEKAGLPTVEVAGKGGAGKAVPLVLDLILRDEKSTKQEAGTQAKALVETDQVHVLIGSVASSNTKQIFQEARESEVPCISPASTNDTLTAAGGPFTSRICFKDGFQGAVLAKFALSQGWKKAAVVVDKAQDYSVGLADNFKETFEAGGGTVSFQYYVTEDTDFSNVIQNVANDDPSVIFISGYYTQAGPMIKQAKGKWDGKPIIGGDGLDSPDLIDLVGDTNAEIYLSSHFAADAPDERVRAFAKRYKEKFGKSPGAMAALGYDVMFVLMDAVRRCDDPFDAEKLAQAIRETKGVKGITGTISLDNEDRTPVKDAVIVKVDGALKFHKKIEAGGS